LTGGVLNVVTSRSMVACYKQRSDRRPLGLQWRPPRLGSSPSSRVRSTRSGQKTIRPATPTSHRLGRRSYFTSCSPSRPTAWPKSPRARWWHRPDRWPRIQSGLRSLRIQVASKRIRLLVPSGSGRRP
jgi:hypothetical protein